jgi:hypothetical protein
VIDSLNLYSEFEFLSRLASVEDLYIWSEVSQSTEYLGILCVMLTSAQSAKTYDYD